MKSEQSVEINCRIEDVFRMIQENAVNWSNFVVEQETLDEAHQGVGTRFRTVTEDRGRRMEYQGVVTSHDPPHTLASKLRGTGFDVEAAYSLESRGYRTKVTQFCKVTGKGPGALMFFLMSWMFKGAFLQAQEKELNSLKTYCEAQA